MKEEMLVVFLAGFAVGVVVLGIVGVRISRQIHSAKTEVSGLLERVARAAEKR
jgi:uncharacterized membrane protein YciS (DUF1049 family)